LIMKAITTILLLILTLSAQTQVIRYVRVDGTGDGSSWQMASGNLQNMINASAAGDEVWVGAGVYKPTAPITDPLNLGGAVVNRYSTFTMKSGVKIYGSFPATGTPNMNDRNYVTHMSIFSGEVGVENDVTDNCFHICFFPNTSDALLDGFLILGGFANGNSNNNNHITDVTYLGIEVPNFRGSAMYIHEGNNQIHNCYFADNNALREGGAVYISSGSQEFSNNTFSNNQGRSGGGAVCCAEGNHTFGFNMFAQNYCYVGFSYPFPMISASDYARGGAIYAFNADLNLEYNTFFGNVATVPNNVKNAQGGALCFISGAHNIRNCEFTSNAAMFLPTGVQVCSGGAIFIQQANSIITNCEFDENISHGEGGAIRISLGTMHEFSANRFKNNSSVGNGGAFSVSSTNLSAYNNIFDGNSSEGFGGTIHCQGSVPSNSFVNNTFYNNSTLNTQGSAGIYMDGGVHHILNNIFYENKMSNGSTTATGADVRFYNSTGSTFLNNLYQTGSTNPENGNIGYDGNNNPLFVDAENGDFSLQATSPCINAGSNTHYLSAYDQTDFLSNERVQGGIVDMGAVEFTINTSGIIHHTQTEEPLVFYPNPVKTGEKVHVQLIDNQSLQLLDLSGKVTCTFHGQIGENSILIDVPTGMYFLQSNDGKRIKIIVL